MAENIAVALAREDARAAARSALKAMSEKRDDLAIAFLKRAAARLENLPSEEGGL